MRAVLITRRGESVSCRALDDENYLKKIVYVKMSKHEDRGAGFEMASSEMMDALEAYNTVWKENKEMQEYAENMALELTDKWLLLIKRQWPDQGSPCSFRFDYMVGWKEGRDPVLRTVELTEPGSSLCWIPDGIKLRNAALVNSFLTTVRPDRRPAGFQPLPVWDTTGGDCGWLSNAPRWNR